jgi:hypothetical protein
MSGRVRLLSADSVADAMPLLQSSPLPRCPETGRLTAVGPPRPLGAEPMQERVPRTQKKPAPGRWPGLQPRRGHTRAEEELLALQGQAGNAAVVSMLAGVSARDAPSPLEVQRDTPAAPGPAVGSTPAPAGESGAAPMSEDIRKLGPEGIPHAANRVRDAAEKVFDSSADGLKVFEDTERFKDVERPTWDKELVIAIAGLALGGFVSRLLEVEVGKTVVQEAAGEAWKKGFEAAMEGATERTFRDAVPTTTYPIVAFMQGQRQILLEVKSSIRDHFDNHVAPALHREALRHPKQVPGILDQLQQMIVDYDNSAKTAGADQFRRTFDAWNVYVAKTELIPAKVKREKTATPLAGLVSEGAAPLDFPGGVLRIECEAGPGFKKLSDWHFEINGLNESLRSAFTGRKVADVHIPEVAIIHQADPPRTIVIGRNEAGELHLDASSDARWALMELAVPNWRQVAQDVREGKARPRLTELDVMEGARIVMERIIGVKAIDEVKKVED